MVVWLLSGMLLWGCDVHEFPEPEVEDTQVTLHLDFTLELPPYKDIIYSTNEARAQNRSELLDLRYIIKVYRYESRGYSAEPCETIVVTEDNIDQLNRDVGLILSPGSYKFMVWTDYVQQGSVEDYCYSTADFSTISIIFPHRGNDDSRDAFLGVVTADIPYGTSTNIVVDMERPLGKFRFVATDYGTFMSRAEEELRLQWEQSRADDPVNTPAQMPVFNADDYKVVIRYPGYMPHVFNMNTNRPVDATTGVSFKSKIVPLNDVEAELGFDYIFINGSEAPYTLAVEIYDKNDKLVGSSGSIDIPIMRSMLTTVRGDFLTSKTSGGVGINPEFEGEFNIFFH